MPSGRVLRILVDHGCERNLGDLAMLEGVLRRYHQRHAGAVRARPVPRRSWSLVGAGDAMRVSVAAQGRLATALRAIGDPAPALVRVAQRRRRAGRGPGHLRGAALALAVRRFDGLHLSGGGYLTDVFPDDLLAKLDLIEAFLARGKPVVLTGQQLGPFADHVLRDRLLAALGRVGFLGVREPTASLALAQPVVAAERLAVTGDDSFGLPAAAPALAAARLAALGLRSGGFIACNLRLGAYAAELGRRVEAMVGLLRAVQRGAGLPLLVVPVSLNDEDSDLASGRRLQAALGAEAVRVLDAPGLDARLAKAVLAQARGAVGVSYHFCTFALSAAVPAVCLHDGGYYGQKARGLCALWEEADLHADLAMGSAAPDAEGILRTLADAPLRARLARRAADLADAWSAGIDQALDVLLEQPDRRRRALREGAWAGG